MIIMYHCSGPRCGWLWVSLTTSRSFVGFTMYPNVWRFKLYYFWMVTSIVNPWKCKTITLLLEDTVVLSFLESSKSLLVGCKSDIFLFSKQIFKKFSFFFTGIFNCTDYFYNPYDSYQNNFCSLLKRHWLV